MTSPQDMDLSRSTPAEDSILGQSSTDHSNDAKSCVQQSVPPSPWRKRLGRLSGWNAITQDGPTPPVSEDAVRYSSLIAADFDCRIKRTLLVLSTVVTPTLEGGIQLEWTARGRLHSHLEIEIPADPSRGFEVLETLERPNGTIQEAQERSEASWLDVQFAVGRFLEQAKDL